MTAKGVAGLRRTAPDRPCRPDIVPIEKALGLDIGRPQQEVAAKMSAQEMFGRFGHQSASFNS
jgi:hypothetical protein